MHAAKPTLGVLCLVAFGCRGNNEALEQCRTDLDGQRTQTTQTASDLQNCRTEINTKDEQVGSLQTQLQTTEADKLSCEEQLDPFLNPPEPDLKTRLLSIEGLDVEELQTSQVGYRAFAIKIEQPLDHDDPQAGTFKQRFVLHHRDAAAPMILSTTGYGLFGGPQTWVDYLAEPTMLTEGNQIVLEHRYFEGSLPAHQDPAELDWSYLTIQQSASDSHAIVTALSAIYEGPWIATGHSKGGMTAIFHQHFYPEDLAGIVPYVAPISFGTNDTRYEDFMDDQIGPDDGLCRQQVEDLALQMITRRAEIALALPDFVDTYRVFRPEMLELSIAGGAYSSAWSSWQFFGGRGLCDFVPQNNASIQELTQWISSFMSPQGLTGSSDPYSSYGYQVVAELGGPSYRAAYLDNAIQFIDFSQLPRGAPPAWTASPPQFNPNAMVAVDSYLKTSAENVLGIYGAWDPWYAGRITVNEATGSKVFVAPQASHEAAIANLMPAEQSDAVSRLMSMAGRSSFAPPWPAESPIWERTQQSRNWIAKLYRTHAPRLSPLSPSAR